MIVQLILLTRSWSKISVYDLFLDIVVYTVVLAGKCRFQLLYELRNVTEDLLRGLCVPCWVCAVNDSNLFRKVTLPPFVLFAADIGVTYSVEIWNAASSTVVLLILIELTGSSTLTQSEIIGNNGKRPGQHYTITTCGEAPDINFVQGGSGILKPAVQLATCVRTARHHAPGRRKQHQNNKWWLSCKQYVQL